MLRRYAFTASCALATVAHAQRSSFVTTLGRDTLSFEQYSRVADTITGDWVTLYGGIMYHHYVIVLRGDGTVARYSLNLHRASGKAEGSVTLQLDPDSITATSDGNAAPRRVAGHADAPLFANTIALLETIVTRARLLGRDSVVMPVVAVFAPEQRGRFPIIFFAADSARIGNPRAPLLARVSASGRIEGLSARATTTRTETRRVPDFDLATLARHFRNVGDDVPILGVPSISPRDTVSARLDASTITIDYGRPSVRGRDVFAHGVLGDTVWRAGANAATQFTTTADLIVAGKRLAAGKYSLWIHVPPDNSSYDLVFNAQFGQWGTEHHFERDVLSVPLVVHQLPAPVLQLAISLESMSTNETVLHLRWADRDLSVPITLVR
jgi:hypothetical protein